MAQPQSTEVQQGVPGMHPHTGLGGGAGAAPHAAPAQTGYSGNPGAAPHTATGGTGYAANPGAGPGGEGYSTNPGIGPGAGTPAPDAAGARPGLTNAHGHHADARVEEEPPAIASGGILQKIKQSIPGTNEYAAKSDGLATDNQAAGVGAAGTGAVGTGATGTGVAGTGAAGTGAAGAGHYSSTAKEMKSHVPGTWEHEAKKDAPNTRPAVGGPPGSTTGPASGM